MKHPNKTDDYPDYLNQAFIQDLNITWVITIL